MELIIKPKPTKYIKFKDIEIELDSIKKFLDEAYEFEHTIGQTGNYDTCYLYFTKWNEELLIEKILLDYNAIIVPDIFKNQLTSSGTHKYWLHTGYYKFKEDLEKIIYK